jgi:hypothetical protein
MAGVYEIGLLKSLAENAPANCSFQISRSLVQDWKKPVREARKLGYTQFISQANTTSK